MVERAETAGVRLLHENEHRIYGDSPERVADLLRADSERRLCGRVRPGQLRLLRLRPVARLGDDEATARSISTSRTGSHGEKHGRVAGEGDGRIADVLADAVKRGYDGFATLEPHLLGGGPTGGVTGPELFPKAVEALRAIFRQSAPGTEHG